MLNARRDFSVCDRFFVTVSPRNILTLSLLGSFEDFCMWNLGEHKGEQINMNCKLPCVFLR